MGLVDHLLVHSFHLPQGKVAAGRREIAQSEHGAANLVVLTVAAHKKAHFPGRGVRRISTSARGDEKSTQRYFSQMGLPTRYRYTTAVSTPRFTVYYSAKCTT